MLTPASVSYKSLNAVMVNIPTHPQLPIDQSNWFVIMSQELLDTGGPYPPNNPVFREPDFDFAAYYYAYPPEATDNTFVLQPVPESYYNWKLADRIDKLEGYSIIKYLDQLYSNAIDKKGLLEFLEGNMQEFNIHVESLNSRTALISWLANKSMAITEANTSLPSVDSFPDTNQESKVEDEESDEIYDYTHRQKVALLLIMVPRLQELFADTPLTVLGKVIGALISCNDKRTEDYIRYANTVTSGSGAFAEKPLNGLLKKLTRAKIDTTPIGKKVADKIREVKQSKGKQIDE
ncbi:hypothetical protein [Hymenobacter volaticus]|uniref:Uncharacterized protein n=1 Tax=Hymenobacter volaticus TaxID=2932254 RepID=A0ABY4G241_9BACT|nr:hypothetical protein [Hymenobacter volaticus]UOQ64841.1 hypothetical protein MUN86_14850 [Hymenobacter volaticus]